MGAPEEFTIEAALVAKRSGEYTKYIFKSNYKKTDKEGRITDEFISVVKPPNWRGQEVDVGQNGFLQYKFAQAGDTWFNKETGGWEHYGYTANYFIDFVPMTHVIEGTVVKELIVG